MTCSMIKDVVRALRLNAAKLYPSESHDFYLILPLAAHILDSWLLVAYLGFAADYPRTAKCHSVLIRRGLNLWAV
jgi:hypothetical protein